MRIAIGQLWQETNTFNPLPTTAEDFQAFGVLRGAELVQEMADTNELGGFIQSLSAWPERPEIVGLARLPAWPSGPLTADARRWLFEVFDEALAQSGPLDGVLLALHGALAGEDDPDVTGTLLARTRRALGPGVPLVATLDLHANVTKAMIRAADALVLFHTVPHVDVAETGQRGAAVLRRLVIDGIRPVTSWVKLPLVLPAERANTEQPGTLSAELKARLIELEQQAGILAAGLATVQPWLDVPELGSAVVMVSTPQAAEQAAGSAEQLAELLWRRRREYLPELVPVHEAVRLAWEQSQRNPGLVVLSDPADATTSGAPGDSTALLAELLKYRWSGPVLITLVAPEVVEACQALGPGGTFVGPVGGRRDTRFSRPLPVTAQVERLFQARFILSGHLSKNLPIDMGPSAVLALGAVQLVVTSRSGPHFAPQLFQAAGIDPFAAAVLVAKSPAGFRAAYQSRARQIWSVSAPGCAPPDFWNYSYRRRLQPCWPWEADPTPAWKVEQWQADPPRSG